MSGKGESDVVVLNTWVCTVKVGQVPWHEQY